jgi:prophage tail gpP-like protein
MGWTNPLEVATLTVNGRDYTDWTSVTVIDDTTQAYPLFSFECTEFTPVPTVFGAEQIKPGDTVTVSLAGQQVLFGFVIERQVGYDGKMHAIMISGTSLTHNVAISSILPQTNGNYDNMTFLQIATKAAAYHGVPVKSFGDISGIPFKHSQHQPGEITYSFIERHAKMRNVRMGSTAFGELLLVGPHAPVLAGDLVESQNILRANCVVRDEDVYKKLVAIGQQPGHDDTSGDPANKGVAETDGSSERPVYSIHPADTPTSQYNELLLRAQTQKRFTEGSRIQANITVQGWVQGTGKLWRAGEYYSVTSPMLILNGEMLGCKKITYDQHEGSGTTTVLEMVSPIMMNGDRGGFGGGAVTAQPTTKKG